jgi:endonuclease-3
LKKRYKVVLPKTDRPVLETMLYAVCLENQSPEAADKSYEIFREDFPDLNEARVSQVSELERGFAGREDSEWRGFRLRAVLQFVFEKSFTFEFESLKKKTLDLAVKHLARLKQATPFIRNYTLQSAVGAHVLPIDDSMRLLIIWLGLADPNQSADEIGEALKSHVRKADAATFCQALRMAATEERVALQLPDATEIPPDGYDPATGLSRLQSLWTSKPKPKAEAKPAKSSSTAKPAEAKRKVPKSASKSK